MSSYRHIPHPHIMLRKAARPVKVADLPAAEAMRSRPATPASTATGIWARPDPLGSDT